MLSPATPYFATLAAQGQLDYPLFGLSLTRNATGTLTMGAIDTSVVANASKIVWNEVVPFAPFANQGNSSSYLQWVIRLSGFAVRDISASKETVFNNSQVNGTGRTPIPTYPNATRNASLALLDM